MHAASNNAHRHMDLRRFIDSINETKRSMTSFQDQLAKLGLKQENGIEQRQAKATSQLDAVTQRHDEQIATLSQQHQADIASVTQQAAQRIQQIRQQGENKISQLKAQRSDRAQQQAKLDAEKEAALLAATETYQRFNRSIADLEKQIKKLRTDFPLPMAPLPISNLMGNES